MQSIGERLEDARKRKGISLREAAEATKIRSDFLSNIEQDKFDFDLPDIYKRGFIKNYARYLKLDSEKVITDFNAQQLGNSRSNRKGAEWFGTMELPESKEAPEEEAAEPELEGLGRLSAAPKPGAAPAAEEEESEEDEKIFYLKVGLIFVGTLALVFVLFGLIRAVLGSDAPEVTESPEFREESAIVDTTTPPVAPTDGAATDELTLVASGDVLVVVKQRNDGAVIFNRSMSDGESAPIAKNGPVDILFSRGENIVIEHAGERVRPSASGTAKITLP